jgi:hypothetical protein
VLAQVAAMLVNGAEDQLRLRQNLSSAVQPSVRADDDRAARAYVGVGPGMIPIELCRCSSHHHGVRCTD